MISNSGTSTLGLYDLKRQIDAFGGVDYFRQNLAGGYLKNARVMLANGDIVKSTIDGNTNDPNVDMTGWVNIGNTGVVESIAELLATPNSKDGSRVFVKSIQKWYTFESSLNIASNGVTVVGKWEMGVQDAYYASWFAVPDVPANQATQLQLGYDYATSKKRAFIIDGAYSVDGAVTGNEKIAFYIRSNSSLIFQKGVGKFIQLPTDTQGYDTIRVHEGVKNFIILDPEVVGDRDNHNGTLGEWGYLLTLYDCESGYIRAPKMTKAWGDGIHIGRRYSYAQAKLPKNIIIEDMYISEARRNGLSLTGGENITLVRPTIANTNGVAPQSGIDIEPEESPDATELSYLKNIRIVDATLIDNLEHFNILCNKPNRHVDVIFTGTTKFINTGIHADKFSIYKYTNVIGAKQTGQVRFEDVIWNTAKSSLEMSVNSEDTGCDIIFDNISFSKEMADINLFYVSDSIVPDMPWGGIEFRNILGKGLTRAAQSKFFVTNNKDLLKTGLVLNLPEYVDWVVNNPMQLVDSSKKNINTACTRFGSYSTQTNKLSTYIKYVTHVTLSEPIYLVTGTDYRRLRVEFSENIDVIGFGVNINGLNIFSGDGNLKTTANCKTPGGWIEFQNVSGGRTRIIDSYGAWTFS